MRVLAVTLTLLAAIPVAAGAQIPIMTGGMEFSAAGGATVPFGDFNTVAEPGFSIGATGSYYVMPNIAVGGSIIYNSYGADSADPAIEVDMSIWEFTGHAKYLFVPGPFSPYTKAAIGMFRGSTEVRDPSLGTSSASSNDLGMGGGLGAQMRLPTGNIGFFGEGMAYVAFTDQTNTTYYTLRAGINFYMDPKP